ncbi:beta-1,3-glucan-binding protein [Nomia melanderi]|uniref:beta-1,3-glucan-binding protein n=1 Tax=Nomia melanderi TaxID=2448451 RepID=UPI0013047A31|nr:beta-1,3-glucan-binding protein-like [Nomia melanderi]
MFGYSGFIATFIILFLKFETIITQVEESYIFPEPTFTVLQSNEIQISIPNERGLQFFAFNGNINKRIVSSQVGEISGETYRQTKGKWTIVKKHVILKDGDTIHYWMQAQVNGKMHTKSDQTWIVTTEKPKEKPGTLLFNEDFDNFNTLIWERDIRIPLSPDYEFCVYHNEHHAPLLQVVGGKARFKLQMLEDQYGDRATAFGKMELSGCTSKILEECSRNAGAYSILPPVLSSRLTTKKSFNFRYGRIEIRAKFPQGDWLYPEMYLQPTSNTYGFGYSSGRIILGLARGNDHLIDPKGDLIFDSRKLDFGFRVGTSTHVDDYVVSKINENGSKWTQDFHNYTTIWNKNEFQFFVDGEEVGKLCPKRDGWLNNTDYNKMAPFDKEFYISIGLGVGGIRVFPDGTKSSDHTKPWRNIGAKAMLQFWQAKNDWFPTWTRQSGKMPSFEIDYIRVWSV